jgi:tetratricopeptide (TPR) repeat protein
MARLLAVVLALFVAVGASATERTDRLDALFAQLNATRNPAEAAALQHRIWLLWFTYEGQDPTVRSLMREGNRAMTVDALEAAEEAFTAVTERAPDFAEGWNRRATVRYMRGDYAGSIADIRATLALEPRHFGALSGLGLCYLALDDKPHALEAFEMGLAVNPHLAGAKEQIARLKEALAGDPI